MALTMFILTLGGFWRSWSLSLSFQGKENGKFLTWENLSLRNVSALLDNPSLMVGSCLPTHQHPSTSPRQVSIIICGYLLLGVLETCACPAQACSVNPCASFWLIQHFF